MTEHFRVADRHVGEYLAIKVDPGKTKRVHEPAVGHACVARRGVDPSDPQRPKLTLPGPAVTVRVAERVHRGLAGGTYELVLRSSAALGLRQEFLVLLVRGNSALDPRHPLAPYLQVRQQLADELQVALRHECLTCVTALPRRRFVLVEVALVGLGATETAGPGELEPLLGAAMALDLGHGERPPVLARSERPVYCLSGSLCAWRRSWTCRGWSSGRRTSGRGARRGWRGSRTGRRGLRRGGGGGSHWTGCSRRRRGRRARDRVSAHRVHDHVHLP